MSRNYKGESQTDLTPDSPTWDAPITREGPKLTRGCCQHAYRCTDAHGGDYRSHDSSSCDRTGRLQEDWHEWIACWRLKSKFNVPKTEKHSDEHSESERPIDQNTQHDWSRHSGWCIRDFFGHLTNKFPKVSEFLELSSSTLKHNHTWTAASPPANANIHPTIPTKKDNPCEGNPPRLRKWVNTSLALPWLAVVIKGMRMAKKPIKWSTRIRPSNRGNKVPPMRLITREKTATAQNKSVPCQFCGW